MNIPPGYGVVTPYFFVDNAQDFLRFLVEGLDGRETARHTHPDGRIAHAEVVLGAGPARSTVMVSEANKDYPPMAASYYLYVGDADAAFARAIRAGATPVMEVADRPYGDRQGGVRDPHGNIWWVSQRLVEGPYNE